MGVPLVCGTQTPPTLWPGDANDPPLAVVVAADAPLSPVATAAMGRMSHERHGLSRPSQSMLLGLLMVMVGSAPSASPWYN